MGDQWSASIGTFGVGIDFEHNFALYRPCTFPVSNSMSSLASSFFARLVIRWHSSCCRSRHGCNLSLYSVVVMAFFLLDPLAAISIWWLFLISQSSWPWFRMCCPQYLDTIRAETEPASSDRILVANSFNTFICSNFCELSDEWCLVTYWHIGIHCRISRSSNFSTTFFDARRYVACCSFHLSVSLFYL